MFFASPPSLSERVCSTRSSLIALFCLCLFIPSGIAAYAQEQEKDESPADRLRWFYEQRIFPSDTLKQGYLRTAYQQALAAALKQAPNRAASLTWTPIGPAPAGNVNYSGRVPAVAPHPRDTNTVYIGGADGGVWKTTNGGASWTVLTDGLPTLATGALAIHPSNENILYWGTGEPYNSQDAYGGDGIYKTTDAGTTWTNIGLSAEKRVTKIAINPSNPETLLAATWGGIYRSLNGGGSWTKTSSFTSGWDVAFHPTNSSLAYATAHTGYYSSTDAGATWIKDAGSPSIKLGRRVLSVAPSNPLTIYVLAESTYLYKTTDGGSSWSTLTSLPATLFGAAPGQGWYDIAIGVDPGNENTVMVGGISTRISTDGGATWTQLSNVHVDCHSIAYCPSGGGIVYLGNDGGVYRSRDHGKTVTSVNNNLSLTQFYRLGADQLTPGTIWGASQDNGLQKYTGSLSWSQKIGGDCGVILVDRSNSDLIYATAFFGFHYRSTNGGATSFSSANSGITEAGSTTQNTYIVPVILHPDSAAVLYTASNSIYKSSDTSKTWVKTAISFPWGSSPVRQMTIRPDSSGILFASSGSSGQTMYRSTDRGGSWSSVTAAPLPTRTITSIISDPSHASTVYATYSGTGTHHIFKTTNSGGSWSDINGDLPDIPVNHVLVNPANSLNLFIGTDLGLFSTQDGGTTWVKDYGIPNSAVNMLGLTSDDYLLVATHGRGMFKAQISSGPFITVMSPNGGESWLAGSASTIQWVQSGVTNVAIDYSTNSGSSWTSVVASTPAAAGSYSWTVPNTPTTTALLRITDASNAAIRDTSNAVFTILAPASITVTAPNGGESWNVYSNHSITWTSTSVANAKIDYSTNGGSTWSAVVASTPAAGGTYSWSVPNTPTAQTLVRISDVSNAGVSDVSNAVFSIVAVPSVTVTAPNGGETWIAGTTQNITWTSSLISNVAIEYSANNGSTWTTVTASTAASGGVFSWPVPNTPTSQALVRISDAAAHDTNDVSNAAFTITPPPSITLTSPNGGESWTAATSQPITWSSTSVTKVKIEYSVDSAVTWNPVVASTPASAGTYSWTVPNSPSTLASVRISDTSNSAIRDSSNATFTIVGIGTTITSTSSGGFWDAASTWSGGVVPGALDIAQIALGAAVTVRQNETCSGVTLLGGNGIDSLKINSGTTLTVAGNFTVAQTNVNKHCNVAVNGTLNITGGLSSNGSVASRVTELLIGSTGICTIAGNYTGAAGARTDMTAGGLLEIGGAWTNAGTFVPGAGTVDYTSLNTQTVLPASYMNLTLSGAGVKTLTGVTVNGTLSIEGTATASAVPTYGASASLEYKGSGPQTTGPELPSTMVKSVTVNNPDNVTMGSSVTFNSQLAILGGHLITGGDTATLGASGSLTETAGHTVLGHLQATRTVAQNVNNTFGGIGLEVKAAGGAPGLTKVVRVTGSPLSGGGVGSIGRYCTISPALNSALDATVVLHYDLTELNGSNAGSLLLWQTTDGGSSWTMIGGVDETQYVTATGVSSFSCLTAVDAGTPLSIQLLTFSATVLDNDVKLEWGTVTEEATYGFWISRRNGKDSAFTDLAKSFNPGAGTSLEPHYYRWTDSGVAPSTYNYRVKEVDSNGKTSYSSPISVVVLPVVGTGSRHRIPSVFSITQNYPNPFNPVTAIHYQLPKETRVLLRVYTLLGELVVTLVDEIQQAGEKTVKFDASHLPSGLYFYTIRAGDFIQTSKMLLIR